MTAANIADSVRAGLEGARTMVEKMPVSTDADLRSQVNVLSATFVAVRDVLGAQALIDAAPILDQLIKKGRAARLDVREARALRRVLPDAPA